MTPAQICIMISIVAYMSMVVIIGVAYSKQTKNVGDFYLGGRKLGPLVTAMSAEASDMSSYLLMGIPGLALAAGLAEVSWTVIGLAIGTYLNWLIVAKRLRNYSAKINAITIPDYFSQRYKDNSRIIMAIAALMIIVFFVPYTASGFSACGKLFGTLFGIDYHIAMVVSAIVIVGYTSLGGFNAASITDFIQSIIMTIALLIVLIFGISKVGGMDAVMENARQFDGYLDIFKGYVAKTNSAGSFGIISVVSTLAWGLGYFGMPHILLRFMAIENPNKVKISRRVASVWVVISMAVAVLIGVVGFALVNNGTITGLDDSERIIISVATLLSQNGIVPALIAGVILAGILASTMSTADSQLLAASSSASENIVGGLFRVKLDETKQMIIARVTLIVISVIGVIIAWNENSSVFRVVSFAWAGFGATFGPVVLLSLFWKRSNKYGALAGMISGAVMVFVWKFVIADLNAVLNIYELLPAFVIGLLVNVIVSLATPKPEQEILDDFEAVKAMK
ncbi:MAG: sodium/proline symporter [Eubacterium sp.]